MTGSAYYGPRLSVSLDYFESLQNHAVPLLEADLAALAHSALALDLYACLAPTAASSKSQAASIRHLVTEEQFGPEYGRMNNFKAKFREALRQVRVRYQTARVELDERGMGLFNSSPPVTTGSSASRQVSWLNHVIRPATV